MSAFTCLSTVASTALDVLASPSSLDDGGVGAALLHASLYPLATCTQLQSLSLALPPGPAPAARGTPGPSSLACACSAASLALLQCLSSPSACSEVVTLCLVGLSLCWGSCSSPACSLCSGIAQALSPREGAAAAAAAAAAGEEAPPNLLPPALSSGFLGLLNALCTSRASGEEQACLDVALADSLATLPLRSSLLTAFATGLLAATLGHCAAEGAAAAEAAAAAAAASSSEQPATSLPSPLLSRAAAGPRVLYASDARVAVDIALRAASDVQGQAELDSWLALLAALHQHCCPEYRREEVAAALALQQGQEA